MGVFFVELPFFFFNTSISVKAICFVIILKICLSLRKWLNKKEIKKDIHGIDDIPGPRPIVPIKLIGNLPHFLPLSNTIKQGMKFNREFPGLIKVTGANRTVVGLNSPELVQQLFQSTDFGHDFKAPFFYDKMKPFITNGVLVSYGQFWQSQRKILMKTQRFQNLKAYMEMLNRHSKNFVQDISGIFEDGKSHEINEAINVFFLRIVFEMITGTDEISSELDQFHHNFQTWKLSILKRVLSPWFHFDFAWRWHPMFKKQTKAVQEMFDFAKQKIKKHRESRKMKKSQEQNSERSETFRSVLDELVDAGVKDDQIIDEVNTMIFGGHETGATLIHFFCLMMALNQNAQEKCREEIDALFKNPENFKNERLKFEAVTSNLKYVERCINETLRLYPPVFMLFRQLKAPFLIDHNNKKYLLPVGCMIALGLYGIHRDPKYFPDPEKFDPDRFLPEEVAKRHPFSYIPFSGGARICLGMKFAMLELKVVIAYMLRNFEIHSKEKVEDVPLLPLLTLTPERDFVFEFIRRKVE